MQCETGFFVHHITKCFTEGVAHKLMRKERVFFKWDLHWACVWSKGKVLDGQGIEREVVSISLTLQRDLEMLLWCQCTRWDFPMEHFREGLKNAPGLSINSLNSMTLCTCYKAHLSNRFWEKLEDLFFRMDYVAVLLLQFISRLSWLICRWLYFAIG